MTPPPYLGPRASLLFGLLIATPRTADELLEIAASSIDHAEEIETATPVFGAPSLALRSLVDAGPDEVTRILERLAELGFVDSVDLDGTRLWRAYTRG